MMRHGGRGPHMQAMDPSASEGDAEETHGDCLSCHYADIVLSFLYFVIGVPGNLLIFKVQSRKAVKTTTCVFIIALALADFASCLLRLEHGIEEVVMLVNTGTKIANVGHYCSKAVLFTTACLTATIAFDRYDAVCRHMHRTLTPRRAGAVALLCLLAGVVIVIPEVVFWLGNIETPLHGIATLVPVVLYIITLCMVIVLYCKIYRFIRRQARVIAHHSELGKRPPNYPPSTRDKFCATVTTSRESPKSFPEQGTSVLAVTSLTTERNLDFNLGENSGRDLEIQNLDAGSTDASPSSEGQSLATSAKEQGDAQRIPKRGPNSNQGRTTRMLLMATVVFFTFWLPYVSFQVYRISQDLAGRGPQSKPELEEDILDLLSSLVYVNSVANPFIYGLANRRFRQDCHAVMRNMKPSCCR